MCGRDVIAGDDESPLNLEFQTACDNPADFDFGFQEQREATGFANFGFDPAKAAELRAADPSMQTDLDFSPDGE